MKCEELDLLLIDYLDNTLDNRRRAEIEAHIASCERCMNEVHEFQNIFQSMSEAEMEKPDETLRLNFNYMLQSEIHKAESSNKLNKKGTERLWPSVLLKVAAGIALLIAGAFLGNIIHQNLTRSNAPVTADTFEGNGDEKMVTFTLLHEESPGKRIKAINLVEDKTSPNGSVLHALVNLLNNDNNVNVRLAAAYTLSKFIDNNTVRDSIIASLGKQTEPVIQIALMNMLTEKMEVKAIAPMQKIISDKKTMEQVKYAAKKNINVLL